MKTLIKKWWGLFKKYWWLPLVLFTLILLGVQKYTNNKLNDALQLQNVQLATLNDSVAVFKGKHGELTYKLNATVIEKDNLRKSLELQGFEIADLRKSGVEWRNTIAALTLKLEQSNHGTIPLHDTTYVPTPGDTVMAQTGDWNDRFLFLKPIVQNKKMDFTYSYQTGIDILITPDGKNSIVNVIFTDPIDRKIRNPYGKITTGNSIIVKSVKRWWDRWYFYSGAGLVGGYFLFK